MYTFSLTALSAYSVGERERPSERDGRYKNRPKGVSQNERNDRASGGGIERETVRIVRQRETSQRKSKCYVKHGN